MTTENQENKSSENPTEHDSKEKVINLKTKLDEALEPETLEDTTEEPKTLEQELQEKVADLNNKFLRAVADTDNLRRRTDKEKADILKYGNTRILEDLLPILDSFDKALPQSTDTEQTESTKDTMDDSSFWQGMQLVRQQLWTTLEKHGVQRLVTTGEKFDPNFHQAIQRVEDESCETETVLQEFAAGYTLNGRVIRAAMVSVQVPKG